jgi:hypothetical protein
MEYRKGCSTKFKFFEVEVNYPSLPLVSGKWNVCSISFALLSSSRARVHLRVERPLRPRGVGRLWAQAGTELGLRPPGLWP